MAQTRRIENRARAGETGAEVAIERHLVANHRDALVADVRRGLAARPKTLPAKYLYDEYGSLLFDQICNQPEYYPTRTEEALLAAVADEVVRGCRPAQLVELGSGASRKTRLLLDALIEYRGDDACYVPVDVSEEMLRLSSEALHRDYPGLAIRGIVGDYEHHLRHLPPAAQRMVAFLGSTIGNFTEIEGRRFLRSVRSQLARGDSLLIGFDLVKPVDVLNAAYNDAAGVTAEFNRNVLRVLNRELSADFDLTAFVHEAYFNPTEAQIEMHLRSVAEQCVHIPAAGMTVQFESGESVRTEISRKFTKASACGLLTAGGFSPRRWFESPDGYFALVLASAGAVV